MRILVVGDGCIDEYRYGSIDRVNPESAAPLLTFETSELRRGMAYNVAANLRARGAEVVLSVSQEVSRKLRYIDRRTGTQLLRVDHDVTTQPYAFTHEYQTFDAIVISDYGKGYVTDKTIVGLRKRFIGPIYMDTKKKNLGDFPGIFIKINERELDEATSLPFRDRLIVTYGARGCEYRYDVYPAEQVPVVDVCGAGDVFLAAMVFKHLEAGEMGPALAYANKLAALSCQSIGAVCV